MKRIMILFVAVLAAVVLVNRAVPGEKNAPEGMLILSVTGKKPAMFNHAAHVQRSGGSCRICHHTDEEGTGSKCITCHTIPAQKGVPNGREAFHGCIKCHTPGKGPIYPKDCNTCHVRPGL